jgi:nucleoside-diphosphate-sugar epimerase
MRIVVTGGTGKAGRWVVRDLNEHGYDVVNADLVRADRSSGETMAVDLTDLGQCHDVIAGADAVVHLAAIPSPGLQPDGETFRNNMLSTYNVFSAATIHGVKRVVSASSETVLGLPFDEPPAFAPIDETIEPRPESAYALVKLLGEEMAAQFNRRTGIPFVSLRFSNIMEPDDYAAFPDFEQDAKLRKWNPWGYVDVRDVAQSVRLGLEASIEGAEVCIIAAADTVMTRPSADLMAEVFPDVPLTRAVSGRETLLSVGHAREVLGYVPAHAWQDHLPAVESTGGR